MHITFRYAYPKQSYLAGTKKDDNDEPIRKRGSCGRAHGQGHGAVVGP
jgi:hypothetical protein